MNIEEAAKELLRRRKAIASLAEFAQYIDIPGAPITDDEDEDVFKPITEKMVKHHILTCDVLQGLIEGTIKYKGEVVRGAMIFEPPGSAKTTYGNVVASAWAIGRRPGYNIITTSYQTPLALKQSRKTRSIVKQPKYKLLFDTELSSENSAVEDWALTNESTVRAAGILAGITGNRADGVIIDDPIKGRQEADSETIRNTTKNAIDDDLMTRLKPNAWVCYILTRWHEDDPVGRLLPDDWDGETGYFECSDGEVYYVLSIAAQCDRKDDVLGREIGEYMWPEWFPANHWNRFKSNARTWSALFQQRPQPATGTFFQKDKFNRYDVAPSPLTIWMTSDYAVSDAAGDYTEHSIWGIDHESNIYLLDNWYGQKEANVWIDEALSLVRTWKPYVWFGEKGVIRKSVEPFIKKQMELQKTFVRREWLNPAASKTARAISFQGMVFSGKVFFPNGDVGDRALDQMIRFPTGKHDDFVDTAALMGLVIDQAHEAYIPPEKKVDILRKLTFNDIMKGRRSQQTERI